MASLCLLLLPQFAAAEPGKEVPDSVPLPPGVSKQLTYSLNDITAASAAIFTGARQGLVPMPISGGGNQAFDGVEVAYSADELKHLDQTTLTNQLTRLTGMPTTVVVCHEIHPLIIRN